MSKLRVMLGAGVFLVASSAYYGTRNNNFSRNNLKYNKELSVLNRKNAFVELKDGFSISYPKIMLYAKNFNNSIEDLNKVLKFKFSSLKTKSKI